MSDDKKMNRRTEAPIKRFTDMDEEHDQTGGEFAELFQDSLREMQYGDVVKGTVAPRGSASS